MSARRSGYSCILAYVLAQPRPGDVYVLVFKISADLQIVRASHSARIYAYSEGRTGCQSPCNVAEGMKRVGLWVLTIAMNLLIENRTSGP